MMLWGIGAPSYWRDESDTVSAVSRSLPQLLRLLGHVDAVHGLYYLMLWPVARVLGIGEIVTRLPSALAMAAAALGVAAIARRLASRRAALWAGLVFAALPAVTSQGHDARPYALAAAAAVLASYLFVVAATDPRPRRFAAYGASLVVLAYLHLFALLLICAHAVTLAAWYRRRPAGGPLPPGAVVARGWLVSVTAAAAASVPVAFIGWTQRGQIAWISRPGWHAVWLLFTGLAGGPLGALIIGLLAVAGPASGRGRGPLRWLLPPRGEGTGRPLFGREAPGPEAAVPDVPVPNGPVPDPTVPDVPVPGPTLPDVPVPGASVRGLTWLAAAWLLLPPAMLLAISQFQPVYYFLYVVFCLPAVALLAGAGLASLSWPARLAAAAAIVVLVLPTQLALRVPGSGGALKEAAAILAAQERPGDAIVYPDSGIPPWYLTYPDGFGQLKEIEMAQSGQATDRLYGIRVPSRVLAQRECAVARIWIAEMGPGWLPPGPSLVPGFRRVAEWQPGVGAMRLWLYQRTGGPCVPRLRGEDTTPVQAALPAGVLPSGVLSPAGTLSSAEVLSPAGTLAPAEATSLAEASQAATTSPAEVASPTATTSHTTTAFFAEPTPLAVITSPAAPASPTAATSPTAVTSPARSAFAGKAGRPHGNGR
jgi:mannosyltransferase